MAVAVSPQFEQIVLFSVMSVVVTLFTWIYIRNREQLVGLWLLGWTAVLVYFGAGLLGSFSLLGKNWTHFILVAMLDIAGVCFVLSVSKVYTTASRRILYFLSFGVPAIVYRALEIWAVQFTWVFPVLIIGSTGAVLGSAWRYYRARNLSFYFLVATPAVFAVWAAIKATGQPRIGMFYYVTTLFVITGFLYVKSFQRFSPGVVTTSVSFVLWGLVFPLSTILHTNQHVPMPGSAIWNLPKYMVAFGMILTLLENETASATSAARQYRSLFEGNLAAVYLCTLEGRLLNCNAAFIKMYGCASKEEMLAWPASRVYADQSDREAFLDRLLKDGHIINYECRQLKKDGSLFWILERATIFTDASGKSVIEGTMIDITERKQAEIALKESEERFATIFRHSPIGCALVTLNGVFLNANEALEKMLGRPVEQIVGKTGVELGLWKSQEDRDQFYRRLSLEGSIRNLEIEFVDGFGNRHIGLYFGTLVRLADQECIFGMQLDCTEQRELEAKFLQAQKMEAVGRLAGGVAHDFNNLLGVIGGYAELLETHLREERLRAYCNKILATTQRASGLTSQLLTFSRKEISQPKPLEPNRAIRDLVLILHRLIGEDVEIIQELEATRAIVIDKSHFEQIVVNIVVNARDAMPAGGQLLIRTSDRVGLPSAGGAGVLQYVEIRISDTGTGMDESTRLRAFEPFFTTKETGRGTGLGLATVYGIVQQYAGDIGIESRPEQGTTVSIFLPATESVEWNEEKDTCMNPVEGNGHVLLVEDEVELRSATAEFLVSTGYTVACAGSGLEALQLLEQAGPVDLVITDVVMPKLSGLEFASRLLEMRPSTRLLFVSGYANDVVLKSGISRLGTPFLQKPYTLRQLAAKIQEVLTAETESVDDPSPAHGD
jgi:PAS domain S-box-containing protein